jgi:hypothetical protein
MRAIIILDLKLCQERLQLLAGLPGLRSQPLFEGEDKAFSNAIALRPVAINSNSQYKKREETSCKELKMC